MRYAWVLAGLLACHVGRANPPPDGVDVRAPIDETAAIAAFQAWWAEALRTGSAAAARLDGVVSGATPSVRASSFEAFRKSVRDRVGDPVPADMVVGGTVPEGDGDCLVVFVDGLLRGGVEACVDRSSGKVRFVWATPEG